MRQVFNKKNKDNFKCVSKFFSEKMFQSLFIVLISCIPIFFKIKSSCESVPLALIESNDFLNIMVSINISLGIELVVAKDVVKLKNLQNLILGIVMLFILFGMLSNLLFDLFDGRTQYLFITNRNSILFMYDLCTLILMNCVYFLLSFNEYELLAIIQKNNLGEYK